MASRLARCLDSMLEVEAIDTQQRNENAREHIRVSTNPESIHVFKKSIVYRQKRLALLGELVAARKANDYDKVDKKTQEMKDLYSATFPA